MEGGVSSAVSWLSLADASFKACPKRLYQGTRDMYASQYCCACQPSYIALDDLRGLKGPERFTVGPNLNFKQLPVVIREELIRIIGISS